MKVLRRKDAADAGKLAKVAEDTGDCMYARIADM